jgi:hypothetical protein
MSGTGGKILPMGISAFAIDHPGRGQLARILGHLNADGHLVGAASRDGKVIFAAAMSRGQLVSAVYGAQFRAARTAKFPPVPALAQAHGSS